MLRSRTLRQHSYWTTSSSTNDLPLSRSPSLEEESPAIDEQNIVRRGQSYSRTVQASIWASKLRLGLVVLLLAVFLLFLFVRFTFGDLPSVQFHGRNVILAAPESMQPSHPPVLELKRQTSKKLSLERPVIGRERLLDLGQDEPEHDFFAPKHDIVNLRWPPLVTAVPEVLPSPPETLQSGVTSASVDAQFCPSGPCRFLFPLWIGEQESRGRTHLIQVVNLAAQLNRTLVLPNVGKSRLGGCGKWPFGAYYDVPSFAKRVQELANTPGRMFSMGDFKTWLDMRPDSPVTQMVFVDENTTAIARHPLESSLVARENLMDVRVDITPLDYDDPRLKNARCLRKKFVKLGLDARYPISIRLAPSESPGVLGINISEVLRRDDVLHASLPYGPQEVLPLQEVFAPDTSVAQHQELQLDAEVILVHWDLRHLPFPSSSLPSFSVYHRLHLPAEIVPSTHKKAARPPRPAGVRQGGEGAYRAPRGDRDEYRKKESAPGEFRPQFAGVGRGAPRE